MSDEGTVQLRDIEPGGLFETADGSRWVKARRQHSGRPGFVRLLPVGPTQNTTVRLYRESDTLVRPLTAMPLHPSLRGSDLPGLCAAVMREPNEGTMGRLLDWLGDATGRDPDVSAAAHERCNEVVNQHKVLCVNAAQWEGAAVCREINASIRAMGRPAATAAACETCQGRRGEYLYPDEEGDPGNQLMNLPHWHDCPDCGGTGGATGEGDR